MTDARQPYRARKDTDGEEILLDIPCATHGVSRSEALAFARSIFAAAGDPESPAPLERAEKAEADLAAARAEIERLRKALVACADEAEGEWHPVVEKAEAALDAEAPTA